MPQITAKELQDKTVADLQKDLHAYETELHAAIRSNAAGELPNPRRIRTLRRTVARIKTVLNAKYNNEALTIQGEEEA